MGYDLNTHCQTYLPILQYNSYFYSPLSIAAPNDAYIEVHIMLTNTNLSLAHYNMENIVN